MYLLLIIDKEGEVFVSKNSSFIEAQKHGEYSGLPMGDAEAFKKKIYGAHCPMYHGHFYILKISDVNVE